MELPTNTDGDPSTDGTTVNIIETSTSGNMDVQVGVTAEAVMPVVTGQITNTGPCHKIQPKSIAPSTRRRKSRTPYESYPIVEQAKSALQSQSVTTTSVASTNVEQNLGRHCRSIYGIQSLQAYVKVKQVKYREERENRKTKIDSRYRYIFGILAYRLDLDPTAVEDILLDAPTFQDFDAFFSIGGRRSLIFFYEEMDIPEMDGGCTDPGAAKMFSLVLGNTDKMLKGLCLFFIRCKNDTLITTDNIQEEICFSTLDATDGIFTGTSDLLSKIFLPAINATDNWGLLYQCRHGESEKQRFKQSIANFLSFLADAKVSIAEAVQLRAVEFINFSALQSFQGMMAAAADSQMVTKCEAALMVWYKQIEQVLIESQQIRKETDYSGPLIELEHWKRMLVKFNNIICQIKGQNCKAVITVLNLARSKVFKMWKELDSRITEAANEAKNNVNYLYNLEQVCQPLYTNDLATMIHGIPNLINTIGMLHNVSRYYNISDQITSLFVKVTNQMVTACKAYITERGTLSIWQQDANTVINKIKECNDLYKEYQNCFHRTQEHSKLTLNENVFSVSEMYIFGKLEAFCKRTKKISEILSMVQSYSALCKSTIDGIDVLDIKFKNISETFKTWTYDILDPRKSEFDRDFSEFMAKISVLETEIQAFMSNCFHRSLFPQQAVQLLQRFEDLNIPCLQSEISNTIVLILHHCMEVLETTKKLYNSHKEDPPIARNMPPIAGKILWSRHLFRKIYEPVTYLDKNSDMLSSLEGKAVIRLFNKISYELVEFEVLHHRAWFKDFSQLEYALQATLMVRHPETLRILINFDPKILESIRETKCMIQLGLEVPEQAKRLLSIETTLKSNHLKIENFLKMYEALCDQVHPALVNVMAVKIRKVEAVLSQGLIFLTWSCLILESFFAEVESSIYAWDRFFKKLNDICATRINPVLEEIAESVLIALLDGGPTTVQKLIATNEVYTKERVEMINHKSAQIEQAVKELICIFEAVYEVKHTKQMEKIHKDPETRHVVFRNEPVIEAPNYKANAQEHKEDEFKMECKAIYSYFSKKLLGSLKQCTCLSLELLKRKLFISSQRAVYSLSAIQDENTSFLKAEVHLLIPKVVMIPNLDDIQQAIDRVTQLILEVSRGVAQWRQHSMQQTVVAHDTFTSTCSSPSFLPGKQQNSKGKMVEEVYTQKELENFYRNLGENKEVSKLVLLLSSFVNTLRRAASDSLENFQKYKLLWTEDRESKISQLLSEDPSLSDLESEILHYDSIEQEIQELQPTLLLGSIELNTAPVKLALAFEAKSWKIVLCRCIHKEYYAKLEDNSVFMTEYLKRLSHPIVDLDDVRFVMEALTTIRENEIRIDMTIGLIKEAYAILNRFEFELSREESEIADTLRYSFIKLQSKAASVQDELIRAQPQFKKNLLESLVIFQKDMAAFGKEYETEGPMVPDIPPREASTRVHIFQAKFDDLWRKCVTYSAGEHLLGLPVSGYEIVHTRRKELGLLQKLYVLYDDVINKISGYYDILWTDVDIEKITTELHAFQNRCIKLPKGLKYWQVFLDLKKQIDDFGDFCLLLTMMKNKSMKKRHWDRIADLTGHKLDFESKLFCLRNIMEATILKYKDQIEDIYISSIKEMDIEGKLFQVIDEWNNKFLSFSAFKGRGDLLINRMNAEAMITMMEDSLMVLGSLLNNRYNVPFKAAIQGWIHKLSTSSAILQELLVVQNLWVYLEAVLVAGDLSKQLPQQVKHFQKIDQTWVKIIQRAHEKTNVIHCCVGDEILEKMLPHLHEQLELCQKSLTGYLEKIRLLFPRFFFISDPLLLEILEQAADSHNIQAYLSALSDNINEVEFLATDYNLISSVISQEGEKIQLENPVLANGPAEVWLGKLLNMQQHSLHGVIRSAYSQITDTRFQLFDFLNRFPAQVGLLGIQMLWTMHSEKALTKAKEDRTILQITSQKFLRILNSLIGQASLDLKKYDRVKYEALITIHAHQRDIFDDLVKMHVRSVTDFEWLKQSRLYFDEERDQVIISITDVDFVYQNEFLGCTNRLVITPLTIRCYISLAQAIGMNMVGAPAGPAGTGKTEILKDMGKALGKYVVVFNCSDQMDFRGLERICKGLAQSGSWGVFDEFHRVEFPVMSVAAQQIYIVLTARKKSTKQFLFSDGGIVHPNPEFAIFLTLNPGNAACQELPQNLKIQFRTISMVLPDRQIIIRVKLASIGFLDNVSLSQKCYALYKLCEEQLTKQVHYDFGLRNILSLIRTLGAQKMMRPDESESSIVIRCVRDINLLKLIDEDEPLFLSLISDLFPGTRLDSNIYNELQKAVSNQVEILGLVNHPPWNLKLIQLYEMSKVRHGLMTLGPSGSGKTSAINVLMKAMTECGSPHQEMRMNPKAITAPQMFGRLDTASNDWTDGIFTTLWRKSLKHKKGGNVWIVLDGPVDTIWIENLNSVLDDNKILTLANGDRIPMAPHCKLLFEVQSIEHVSPATVSRMGMVYFSSSTLTWKPILKAWLNTRTEKERDIFGALYDKVFEDAYTHMHLSLNPKMQLSECNYIMQSINLLEGCIPTQGEGDAAGPQRLERLFVFALMWSLGALLELENRHCLERFLRRHESKLDLPEAEPGNYQPMFEFHVNQNGDWEHWNRRVQEYSYPTDHSPHYPSILVPIADNVRIQFLIDIIAKQNKAVLLTGEQGTAKTVMIKAYLKGHSMETHISKSINFSSATQPVMFQSMIESFVEKRIGSTYGPPGGRKMTVFIDDINLPIINDWGDQVTNEIVRQMMEMQGMYSLDKAGNFTTIVDVQIIAAMIHPGGGRNDIPQRLKRQFAIFNCTLPADTSIDKIFGVIACGYFNSCRKFKQVICDLVKKLVPASRALWQMTKVKMLPTPFKFHYMFNLRDLSRIWQGMLAIRAEECPTVSVLLALFKHECQRVIADRFVSQEDRVWFDKSLVQVLEENVNPVLVSEIPSNAYFVDFLRGAPEPTGKGPGGFAFGAPKIYEMIPSLDFLSEKLQQFQKQLNDTIEGFSLNLFFFEDAMTHLIKISRIIRTGNALLVGVGGSGKRSLSRLAAFIAAYRIFQITLTKSYGVINLMDDLKMLFRTAGAEGKGVTFIFTDNDIKDESFLEYINNVLSSGEVSNLFAREELEEITQSLTPVMKKEFPRLTPNFDHLYDYFISRCRNNLRVILCFSPVGEKLRTCSPKYPGLISGCTIDWFSPWPKQALVAVSRHFLSGFDMECSAEVRSQVAEIMGTFHEMVSGTCEDYFQRYHRRVYVTPKSYLSFISSFKNVYVEKLKYFSAETERMNIGIAKLMEASESVSNLSQRLALKEKQLAVASTEADNVLAEVSLVAHSAARVTTEKQIVKDKAQRLMDKIEKKKAIAESTLEAARPALQKAEAALNTIKSADIAKLRKVSKPPHLLMRIMDVCLLLFQKKLNPVMIDSEKGTCKPSWGESLKLMSSTGFLQSLQQFPKDTINDETMQLIQPYFQMEDFTFENAKKVCGNLAGLFIWTEAMASFYIVNKEVEPIKTNMIKEADRLKFVNFELSKVQSQLDQKQAELYRAQAKFDAAMLHKMTLHTDAEHCREKLEPVSALIDGLGGEKVRWTQRYMEFKAQITSLVGDTLLATAFLSYCGPFNQIFRNLLLKDIWETELENRGIPFSGNLNVLSMLVDQSTVSEWNLQGLPGDDHSIQNGIIITKATRYPILIDPQNQGKTWIKNMEKNNELQVTSFNHNYFHKHLEDSLSLGRPLLIEDIGEELDPILDNVLAKNLNRSRTIFKVKVGDKEVDILDTFRLYLTTNFPNPLFSPEIHAQSSLIDFTVTMKGLENQLLERVIRTEKKELEAERIMLMEDVTEHKRKMTELEDNLLYKLSVAKGSMADDESLVEALGITSQRASEVNEKLHIAARAEMHIIKTEEQYRPAATRGSLLYLLITEMGTVNVMYQTSLSVFLKLFDKCMVRSEKSPMVQKRIRNIIEYLTFEVFRYTSRSLYEKHKFLFTLLLTLKIDLQKGAVTQREFQTLIQGGAALDLKECPPKPFQWIPDITWLNLVKLSKLPQFSDILIQVTRNEKVWKKWYDNDAPEEQIVPDGYNVSLDTFRKLLLIRSWCPDRTLSQARKYIRHSLDVKYTEPDILNLESTWKESDNRTPLICFLSMGSDPTNQINALAKKLKLECRTLSMGQGQGVHARRLIQMSMQQGGWVLLQNCHCGLDFMDELLETIQTKEVIHETFRIWLTTEAHNKFPITLLQISIKFTDESPQGMRACLKKTFAGISQNLLDAGCLPVWRPLLYTVAFLHSAVQERRKFGPIGWSIPYEFNSADFEASVQFILNHVDECDIKKGVSWSNVRYMIGEVMYGGRVSDDYDKRLLTCFVRMWFSEKMFDPTFCFNTGYKIPQCTTVEQYLDYVQSLPVLDTPEAFGLHPNADIICQNNMAAEVLDTIARVQPTESGRVGERHEAAVYQILQDMLDKLPPDYIPHEVEAQLQKMGALNPMNIFLHQEIKRMQKVIAIVRSSLTELKLAIDGAIVMSENLREALDNLYNARIPKVWIKASWDSATLGLWFSELLERNSQFRSWVYEGRPNVFWMTGFFNPQGFLTAVRQEETRAHKGWTLETVTMQNEVLKLVKEEITVSPAEGIYIHGLFLDGAGWDKRNSKLIESTPKVLYTMLPVVHIFAVNAPSVKRPMLYKCPVYKSPVRTDVTYVTVIYLRTSQPADHWTLRGVALLCNIK
ncbi:dynein axonemal heavy chain 8 [Pseudophryne corroboree]|uniref:dynein axonemal heavy chain 8 n=1 Tax=Pseudophryne corroboree TaxID=495146 RepID=UPI003081D3EC